MRRFTSFILIMACCSWFTGCAQVRTEFYRNETKHLYQAGCESYKQGEYENARTLFDAVIQLDPDYGAAYAALGNIAMIEEEYSKASEHYRLALLHDPELEQDLALLMAASQTYALRQPLAEAGVGLADIYSLLMEGNLQDIETLLLKDVSLELLAKDTVGITPGQLGELRLKAAEYATTDQGSVRFELFIAYVLFHSQKHDQLTHNLLVELTKKESTTRQEAYVLLGRLYERIGKRNSAVKAFLAAVDAGKPLPEVAHFLARIYKVDIATVLPQRQTMQTARKEPVAVEIALPPPLYANPLGNTSKGPENDQEPRKTKAIAIQVGP